MAIGLTGSPEVLIVDKGYLLGKNRAMSSTPDFSPNTDELVSNNSKFVSDFQDAGLALAPRRQETYNEPQNIPIVVSVG